MDFEYNIDNITAIATSQIAVAAITVAIWQVITTRNHNKLSVVPHLVFERDVDDVSRKVKIILKNNGIGPAIIKSYDVYLDENQQIPFDGTQWTDIIKNSGFQTKYVRGMILEKDSAIGTNEEKMILYFKLSNAMKLSKMQKAIYRINIRMTYTSVYWETKEY